MEVNNVLQKGFGKWLQTLGYAHSTVYCSANYVRDFFFYLKTTGQTIRPESIKNYHRYLQTRKKKNKTGGLSENYITSNINALKRFSKYMQVTGKGNMEIGLQTPKTTDANAITILTKAETKSLYNACRDDVLGIRDRAILSVYYGCGLRRSEGIALDVEDILMKEKRVYVRKGKNYRERHVPMTAAILEDLETYMKTAREKLLQKGNQGEIALFLGVSSKRLSGNAMIDRVQKLAEKANINKNIGLHTLRHSIATHLLQSGLPLEDVSRFLGHCSLESTQIYTHLANE